MSAVRNKARQHRRGISIWHVTGAFMLLLAICTLGCIFRSTLVQPKCRHDALYQAVVVHDLLHIPVRVAIGTMKTSPLRHAQAQAYIGEWKWLCQGPNGIGIGAKRRGFEPERYLSLDEAIERYVKRENDANRCSPLGVSSSPDLTVNAKKTEISHRKNSRQ